MPTSYNQQQAQGLDYIKSGSYYGNMLNCYGPEAFIPVLDTLYAGPFLVRKGYDIDRIQFYVGAPGGIGSVAICGIYDSLLDGTVYPNELIVQGTEQDTNTVSVKESTISATLKNDTLYFLAFNCDVGAPTIYGLNINFGINVLGHPGTTNSRWNGFYKIASTYNAVMPATYPAGATLDSTTLYLPRVLVRAV